MLSVVLFLDGTEKTASPSEEEEESEESEEEEQKEGDEEEEEEERNKTRQQTNPLEDCRDNLLKRTIQVQDLQVELKETKPELDKAYKILDDKYAHDLQRQQELLAKREEQSALDQKISALRAEELDLHNRLKAIQNEQESAQNAVVALETKEPVLQAGLAQLQQVVQNKQQEESRVNENIIRLQKEETKLKQEFTFLQQALQTKLQEQKTLDQKISDLKQAETTFRTEFALKKQAAEAGLSQDVSALKDDIQLKKEERDVLNQSIQARTQEQIQLDQNVKLKKEERDVLNQSIQTRTQERIQLDQNVKKLQQERDALEQKTSNLETYAAKLKQEWEAKLQAWKAQESELKIHVQHQQEEKEELEDKVATLGQTVHDLEQKIVSLQKDEQKLKHELTRLNFNKDQYLVIQQESEDLRQRIVECQGKLQAAQDELKYAKQRPPVTEKPFAAVSLSSSSSPSSKWLRQTKEILAQVPYMIQLVWINAKVDHRQQFLFPVKNQAELEQKYLSRIFSWAKGNPEAVIAVFFEIDSTSNEALNRTWAFVEKEAKADPKMAPIAFREIWNLPTVRQEFKVSNVPSEASDAKGKIIPVGDAFRDRRVPVYCRADVLRLVTTYDILMQGETDLVVYTDFSVYWPMDHATLLDEDTKKKLQLFGIVMAEGHFDEETQQFRKIAHQYENAFHIVQKNELITTTLKWGLIDLFVARIHDFQIQELFPILYAVKSLEQMIYDMLPNFFSYLYAEDAKRKKLRVQLMIHFYSGDPQEYDKDRYGLRPFGTHWRRGVNFAAMVMKLTGEDTNHYMVLEPLFGLPMPMVPPTKQVKRPLSHLAAGAPKPQET